MKINKVNPVGLANLTAISTAIITFIILLLFTLLGGVLGAGAAGGAIELLGGGVILMLVGPLIYGVITWIFTIFYALILNLALKWSGGLQVDTSE
ncbi:hypothetical protein N8660_03590 [Akkermansiaceae bacterium]|nr:hypothetical protein [Akkermansiaceae bacterium]